MQRKFLLTIALGLFSNNCVSKSSDSKAAQCTINDKSKGTALHETVKWQNQFLDRLCQSSEFTEGWALFDQGGFTGFGTFGQVFLLLGKDEVRVNYVKLNGTDIIEKKYIKDMNERKNLSENLNRLSTGLESVWVKAFDAYERELVHVVKDGKTLNVTQRVSWRCVTCKKHQEIESLFESLVQ